MPVENDKKLVSIVVPCYNEHENIPEMYHALKMIASELTDKYDFEFIFEDNASTDGSQNMLREIAAGDKSFKVILNNRNFGPQRSGAYNFYQAKGDAIVTLACDFQDPPELIPKFLSEWEHGAKVVLGRNPTSKDSKILWAFRNLYYKMIGDYTHNDEMSHVSGFGLYDKEVAQLFINERNPVPNFRLSVAEYGYIPAFIDYAKPERRHGVSSYNFKSLFAVAIESLPVMTREPIHVIVKTGAGAAILFMLGFLIALVASIVNTSTFGLLIALLLLCCVGISLIVFCIGIVGEYVGLCLGWERQVPLVIESERINC